MRAFERGNHGDGVVRDDRFPCLHGERLSDSLPFKRESLARESIGEQNRSCRPLARWAGIYFAFAFETGTPVAAGWAGNFDEDDVAKAPSEKIDLLV